jgi:hypothetical protein
MHTINQTRHTVTASKNVERQLHLYEVSRLDPRQLVAFCESQRKGLHVVQPRAHALHHTVEPQALIPGQQPHGPQHLCAHLPRMFQHLDALDNLVRVQHVIVILQGIRTPTVNRRLCAPGTVRRRRTAKVQRT